MLMIVKRETLLATDRVLSTSAVAALSALWAGGGSHRVTQAQSFAGRALKASLRQLAYRCLQLRCFCRSSWCLEESWCMNCKGVTKMVVRHHSFGPLQGHLAGFTRVKLVAATGSQPFKCKRSLSC